jgi:hypothetical protein
VYAVTPNALPGASPSEAFFACSDRVGLIDTSTRNYRILSAVVGERLGLGNNLIAMGPSASEARLAATVPFSGIRHLTPAAGIVPAITPPVGLARFRTHWRSPLQKTVTMTAFDSRPVELQIVEQPHMGTVELVSASTGTFRYVPQHGIGVDHFVVRAVSGGIASPPFALAVDVFNDQPMMGMGVYSYTATLGSTLRSQFTGRDDSFDPLTFAVVTMPTKGTLELNGATGGFVYTPNADASGEDTFTVHTMDAFTSSSPSTVHVSIQPKSDPPPPPTPPPTTPPSAGSSGGGGSMELLTIFALFMSLAGVGRARRRRLRGPGK